MNWKFFCVYKAIFDAVQDSNDDLVEEQIFVSVEKKETKDGLIKRYKP